MLLVEITINGTTHRISMGWAALEHFWDPYIISMDPPRYDIYADYGGYVAPAFGSIAFSHDLFESDWPPPASCPIALYYLDDEAEAGKETIFAGTAHLGTMNREQVSYDLYGPSFDTEIVASTAFDDTLVDVASWFCDAARLNLTLNSTYARDPSPAVKFTTASDELAITLLSRIGAFFTHLFYISGSTLHLVDMLADAGAQVLTEFDFFPSEYVWRPPVAVARTTNHARTSAYSYGSELSIGTEYHDTQINVEAALDNILTVMNKARCELKVPFLGSLPPPGKKISWADTALGQDLAAYIRCRGIRFDFVNDEVIIEGEGELT